MKASWNMKIAGIFIALLLAVSGCSSNAVPTTAAPTKVEDSKQSQTSEQQATTPVKDAAPTSNVSATPASAPVVSAAPAQTPATPAVVTPSPAPKQTGQTLTVYITKTGKKYHRDGCRYLSKSRIPISLSDAESEGYEPCSVCNPPQ
ncbi:hypothetical protein REC12_11650 [Desulfosporosinus sp. PR]|uniref:hypothetical protein n=1 Tax=Candidatus Desulfosporosinus nitrosoreducens TaxID=3401928 RepID=UPI0027EC2D27|nr:hypothetical protein [Desulfosporosinus sp. PR]MDQ7094244.1 hypothetical protein [Desulfosporosinus sp. PR]